MSDRLREIEERVNACDAGTYVEYGPDTDTLVREDIPWLLSELRAARDQEGQA